MALKIAICYYGLADNTNMVQGSNAPNLPVNFSKTYQNHLDTLILENNADVFVHTWSDHVSDFIKDKLSPIGMIAEKQIDFMPMANQINGEATLWGDFQKHHIMSRWYSTMKSVELKTEYETKYNFKYDLVMLTRFDCIYNGNWNLSSLDPNYFYISGGWNANYDEEYPDLWFIGHSSYIDKLATMYNNIDKVLFSNLYDSHAHIWGGHLLVRRYLGHIGLLEKVRHFKTHASDSNILRG